MIDFAKQEFKMKCDSADYKEFLIANAHKIHTTELGVQRMSKNLHIEFEGENPRARAVEFCVKKILSPNCRILRRGKNWYCRAGGIEITVNAHSFTIITVHPF